MSDITMCVSGCSKRLLCKRWTAPIHSHRQSVSDFKPDAETGICENYYPNAVAEGDTSPHYIYNNQD